MSCAPGMAGTLTSHWLHCAHPLVSPGLRLVCFPHAGGAASFYRTWGRRLHPDAGSAGGVEVHAVRYPGRAERLDEAPATNLRDLAADIAAAVALLADRPLALFGHSLGAAVALETARSLQERGIAVTHLFASGSTDAPLPAAPTDGGPDEDEDEEILRLLALGGTPPELAADPDFRELVMPYVRADGRMFHDYVHRTQPRLTCPVTAIVGDPDADADRRPWSGLTDDVDQVVVPGGHFYLIENPPLDLLARLSNVGSGR